MYSIVSVCLKTSISQFFRLSNSRILTIKSERFLGYYFYMKTNIKEGFQLVYL